MRKLGNNAETAVWTDLLPDAIKGEINLLQFAFFVNLNLAILMVDIHRQCIMVNKKHSCNAVAITNSASCHI